MDRHPQDVDHIVSTVPLTGRNVRICLHTSDDGGWTHILGESMTTGMVSRVRSGFDRRVPPDPPSDPERHGKRGSEQDPPPLSTPITNGSLY